ncbi:hypothetical protein [Nocardia sp. NPDC051570]|uniref:hypothetical protein n=1 Tax=Nocardia sp. NPDC051570 TaxID=3364324 RepID=UPI0037BDB8ED
MSERAKVFEFDGGRFETYTDADDDTDDFPAGVYLEIYPRGTARAVLTEGQDDDQADTKVS